MSQNVKVIQFFSIPRRLTNEIRSAEMHYLQTLSDPAAHGYADLHANSQALAALPNGLQGIKGGQGG